MKNSFSNGDVIALTSTRRCGLLIKHWFLLHSSMLIPIPKWSGKTIPLERVLNSKAFKVENAGNVFRSKCVRVLATSLLKKQKPRLVIYHGIWDCEKNEYIG